MNDLINKLNPNLIKDWLGKYHQFLQHIHDPKEFPLFLYIIDSSINYIKEKYPDVSSEWKAWTMILIKKLHSQDMLKTEDDIFNNIKGFLKYKEDKYDIYLNNVGMYVNEYYRDCYFIDQYIKEMVVNLPPFKI